MLSFLFIDSERVWRGGHVQIFTLIQGLHHRGHRVHLVCFPGTTLETQARDLGISVHTIAIRSEAGVISLFRLYSVLRSVRPDFLAFNTPKPILLGKLASRFAPTGARIIFRRVDFPLRRNFISRMKYTRGIDCIIAISQSIKARLQQGGVPASLIKTIYEGVDLSLFPEYPEPEKRPPDARVTVGAVSHLSHEKGLSYLVEASALIPDVKRRARFIVVGDGPCREELQNLVRDKGLESCYYFAGFQTVTSDLLKDFDIFVQPSLSEGLGSAIMEAMACSLPVIGSRVGGIPELVRDGENGLLVPPADAENLSKAMQQLLNNPENCRKMGMEGRKRVEAEFTIERKILETEKLCNTLLGKSKTFAGQPYA
ncbi:MAG: glycosyltransferase [Acidobacteria bacterium]|nr:glycosyltransferase [Acidobacteriota bacterium]